MSFATELDARVTPEDLLMMPDGDRYELINGCLVEQPMSLKSSWVAGQVFRILARYLDEHPIGDLFPEGTAYRCFPDGDRIRKADASFIRRGRLSSRQLDEGYCDIAPDLAVEVVSPHDSHVDVAAKLADYFSAGVPLVWLVEPETRTVTIYRDRGTSISLLQASDELTGETLLPGFRCRVTDLFPSLETAPAAAANGSGSTP